MHQTGPRILLLVTHKLYVNQVCHDVGRCVKDGSCSSSSLSESQWTVLMGYLTISTSVDCRRYQTHHRWQFFFQEDSALVHCACNTVQLLQRSRLIQRLSEKCDFRVSLFCHVVQKHKLFEVALKHLLIAYFIGNISAQKYQILFMCVKVITSNSWDVFLRHGVFSGGAGTDIRWSGGLCMRFLGTVMWIATFSVCRPNFIAIFTYNCTLCSIKWIPDILVVTWASLIQR